MKIRISASRIELLGFIALILVIFLLSTLVGGFFVGHQADRLIGYLSMSSIEPNSIGSDKIKNGGILADDIANGSVTGRMIPDESITSVKIMDGTIQAGDIMDGSIPGTKIQSINWSQITDAPTSARYGGIGYRVPANAFCSDLGTPRMLLPNENGVIIFADRIVIYYNWSSSNIGGCPGSGTYTERSCGALWFGADGWKENCSCEVAAGIPCP